MQNHLSLKAVADAFSVSKKTLQRLMRSGMPFDVVMVYNGRKRPMIHPALASSWLRAHGREAYAEKLDALATLQAEEPGPLFGTSDAELDELNAASERIIDEFMNMEIPPLEFPAAVLAAAWP